MVVLVIGNGSIGKQHVDVLLRLGVKPIVFTDYPDNKVGVLYINSFININHIDYAMICTPTSNHFHDFKALIERVKVKKILIEKPVALNTSEALEIKKLASNKGIKVYIGYDMRFISKLQFVRNNLYKIITEVRLVKIYCGQYLPEWRLNSDYRNSYSSFRARGGGVDLDLSHEVDYMLWLFGDPKKIEYLKTDKLSSLEIDSPDYFKGIYRYNEFIVDLELDYFRKLDRKLIIIGENKDLVNLNFINDELVFNGENILINASSINNTLEAESREFLYDSNPCNLCTLNESIEDLKMINQ